MSRPAISELVDQAKRELWLTVQQFGALMQMDTDAIYDKIKRGEIPGVRRYGKRGIRIRNPESGSGLV